MLFAAFLWMVMSIIHGNPCNFVDDPIAYIPWIAMEICVLMPYLVAITIMLSDRRNSLSFFFSHYNEL